MPATSNAISNTKSRDAWTNSNNVSDSLMAWRARKYITKISLSYKAIRVTDTAGDDFDENLACVGLSALNIFKTQLGAFGVKEGGFVSLG